MFKRLFSLLVCATLLTPATSALAQSANGDGAPGPNVPMHGLPPEGDGPIYLGAPDFTSTASLIEAGGGAAQFSIKTALVSMVGEKLTDTEMAKLSAQYGPKLVADWVNAFDYVVQTAALKATAAGVKLPPPTLKGTVLAAQLVKDGSGDGVFWTGTLLDHLVTHAIHVATMDDIDAKNGELYDGNYHRVTDQAMYDLAQALGANNVGLAFFH